MTYSREETKWGCADGRYILVKDLADDHLVNIINWITDHPYQYTPKIKELMIQEVKFRKINVKWVQEKDYNQQKLILIPNSIQFIQDLATSN